MVLADMTETKGDKRIIGLLINSLDESNLKICNTYYEALTKITGKRFGNNRKEWESWWKKEQA